ncbi:MAG: hypothetical protein M4D80_29075 [Myxococcota bacterium]|nr:hypothetical protein [Deltaproteobacteria bacterium]MDQ3339235.1 hypothetical protein [Myxococcota bacterium]
MSRAVLLVVLVSMGCAPARSKAVGRTGMVMSIAGVVGIIASAAASSSTNHSDEMMFGSSAVSAIGILVYAAHELSGPEIVYRQEDPVSKHMRWARILTEHAAGAARTGNCARVRKFEPRVRVYDSNYHDFVFMKDPEILRCLSPAPAGEAIEPSEP